MTFDQTAVRKDFPILWREIDDKPLVYLDWETLRRSPSA